jgi:hypothetical protein
MQGFEGCLDAADTRTGTVWLPQAVVRGPFKARNLCAVNFRLRVVRKALGPATHHTVVTAHVREILPGVYYLEGGEVVMQQVLPNTNYVWTWQPVKRHRSQQGLFELKDDEIRAERCISLAAARLRHLVSPCGRLGRR